MGKNSDMSLGPVAEYEVVRIASAFAMDLNQMVAGITLLNAPIPMAKIINDFAGMYFPTTFKFQLELHVSQMHLQISLHTLQHAVVPALNPRCQRLALAVVSAQWLVQR
jgi:hypothetical protein